MEAKGSPGRGFLIDRNGPPVREAAPTSPGNAGAASNMSLIESAQCNAEMGNGERERKTDEAEDRNDAEIGNALGPADGGLCKSSHGIHLPLITDGRSMAQGCFRLFSCAGRNGFEVVSSELAG
jgi:hypothetical protein